MIRRPQGPNLRPPTRADIPRREYGRYRANNDLYENLAVDRITLDDRDLSSPREINAVYIDSPEPGSLAGSMRSTSTTRARPSRRGASAASPSGRIRRARVDQHRLRGRRL